MVKSFYDQYWKSQDILSDFEYKWPVIKKLLPPNAALRLLDFGCGTAYMLKEVVKIRPDYHVYGVDISSRGLSVARRRVPLGKFRLVSDNQHIPFPSNSFDIILALDVLEHLYDTKMAFAQLARVLKPNGVLIVTVPYNGKLKFILATLLAFDWYFSPYSPHIRFFREASIKKCLRDAHLALQKIGYFGRFFPLSRGMYATATKR